MRSLWLMLLLACPVLAQPAPTPQPTPTPAPKPAPVVPPKPVVVSTPTLVGEAQFRWLIEVKAVNVPVGTAIIWDVYDSNGSEQTVDIRIVKAEKAILVAGPVGTYKIKARLIKGEDVTQLVWNGSIVGAPAPVPVPVPVPPAPTPVPTPVTPLTPFQSKVRDATKSDGATKDQLTVYAALFRQASITTVQDVGITSGKMLLDEFARAVQELVKANKLPKGSLHTTAQVLGAEMAAQFGKITTMDSTTRNSIAAEFVTFATALELAANGL